MKTPKTNRWQRQHHRLPLAMHVFELVLGVIILAAGQNFWAAVVRADADITPPSVPTNLQMTGRSATTIDISWDASTDDTGVTGYRVYRNNNLVSSPSGTTFSDSGLTPNTSYSYKVSALDAATNESAQSSALAASTLADTSPPSVPGNLHQTGQSTSTVSIAWNASSDNVAVTGYDIYRNGSLIRTQAGTSYTDTGLAVYTSYTYNITAHDAVNNTSNLSSALYAATAQDTIPPSVPDNVHKTSSTISTITLAWNASTDDVGVTGYRVYRDGNLVGSPGGTSFTDTGLNVSTNYTYTISAYDAATNQSAQSAPYFTSSSNDTTSPTIPTNLHTTSVLDGAISLAWTASSDDVGVTGYKIYRNASLVGTSPGTSFNDTGLTPATNYTYTVAAYDAANNTSAVSSSLATQTAYDTTLPSVPANLTATNRTDTTISLSWDIATDNIAVSGYDLYRGNTLITTTVGTSFTDTSLSVDTDYTYRVRARDHSDNVSAQSSPYDTSTLPDLIDPSTPTGLAADDQTTTSVDLSWNAATDDVAVAGYRIYRNGNLVGSPTGLSFTDNGLHYNTLYHYTVTAVDASDNESPVSAQVNASTLPDTAAPSVALTAPPNGQTVQFTILLSATASDDLDLNRVEFYVDSTLVASIGSPPFALNWDSYAVHNTPHTITAKAYDASGNFSSSAATITVNNPPPPIVADLNGDHKVNIYDLSILLSHWRKPGAGDFNNNGRVDIFDLSVLLARFGQDNSNYH